MKTVILSKQCGAVLAFTLVMLLLLTLVGVSMIQQNKQQLVMAGNVRQQNQVFADVESQLFSAEPLINQMRYVDANVSGICKLPPVDPDSIPQLIVNYENPNNGGKITSEITEIYCFTKDDNVLRCNAKDDPTSLGCQKWKNPSVGCDGEIYTIETTVTDTASGTQRKIESKYAINCEHGYM